MQIGDLSENDRRAIEAQVAAAGNVDGGRAHRGVRPAVGSHPRRRRRADGEIQRAASSISSSCGSSPSAALVVLVAEDGQVENRVLNMPVGLPTSALTEAANFLNAHVRGHTLAEAKAELEKALEAGQAELDQLTQKIVAAGLASWSGGESDDRQLIVRGHAHLLEDLKAARGSRAGAAPVRRPGDQARRRRPARPRRAGRRRAHLHRLGEQAVLAVGLVDHRRALSRRAGPHRRRHRRHRPDPAQLRADRSRWSTTPPRWSSKLLAG